MHLYRSTRRQKAKNTIGPKECSPYTVRSRITPGVGAGPRAGDVADAGVVVGADVGNVVRSSVGVGAWVVPAAPSSSELLAASNISSPFLSMI